LTAQGPLRRAEWLRLSPRPWAAAAASLAGARTIRHHRRRPSSSVLANALSKHRSSPATAVRRVPLSPAPHSFSLTAAADRLTSPGSAKTRALVLCPSPPHQRPVPGTPLRSAEIASRRSRCGTNAQHILV